MPKAESTLRVLIVEDDKPSRVVLRHILTADGQVELHEATDGLQAWEMFAQGLRPDLCFLDINMPRMDGLELLRRIRSDAQLASLKVCFCSAIRDRNLVGQACTTRPDFYVIKPYSPQTIQQILEKTRSNSGTQVCLEPMEAVCERLRIPPEAYLESIQTLIEQIQEMKVSVPERFMKQDIDGVRIALEGAKLHSKQLGAHRLHRNLEQLTSSLKSSILSGVPQFTGISGGRWPGHFAEELMKGMQRIHDELEQIRIQEQRLGKAIQEAKVEAERIANSREAELAALAQEIARAAGGGKLITSSKGARARALEVSIKAPVVGGTSEEHLGSVTRKTSLSLAIPDRQTCEDIEQSRKITDILKALSISIETNLRWIPDGLIPDFNRLIALRNESAVGLLRRGIGNNLEQFLHKEEQVVRDHLRVLMRESQPDAEPDPEQVKGIVETIGEKLKAALNDGLVAGPTMIPFDAARLPDPANDASWAAAFALLYQTASLFRCRTGEGTSDEKESAAPDRITILKQMNLFDDCMARVSDPKQAAAELGELRKIAEGQDALPEKCRLIRQIIRGSLRAGQPTVGKDAAS